MKSQLQRLRMWLRLHVGRLKRCFSENERVRVGPKATRPVSLQEEDRGQDKACEDTSRRPPAPGLREQPTRRRLVSDVRPPELREGKFMALKSLGLVSVVVTALGNE